MNEKGLNAGTDWLCSVRRIYLSSAPVKLAELDRAISGLEENPSSSSQERRLRRLLHNLIGSGASYGFSAVTDAARGMLECLDHQRDDNSPFNPETTTNLRNHLQHLRRIFNEAQA